MNDWLDRLVWFKTWKVCILCWLSIQRKTIIGILRFLFSENWLGAPVRIECSVVSISNERSFHLKRVRWVNNLCSFIHFISFKCWLRGWSLLHFMLDWSNFFICNIKKVSCNMLARAFDWYFGWFFIVELLIVLSYHGSWCVRDASFKVIDKVSIMFWFSWSIVFLLDDSLNHLKNMSIIILVIFYFGFQRWSLCSEMLVLSILSWLRK